MIPSRAVEQAEQDLSDISTLRKTPAFDRYFLRRLREKQAALATEILERDDIPHEEREQLRAMHKLVKTLLAMPEQDEACFLKTLSQRG
jgi:hypothetical protein